MIASKPFKGLNSMTASAQWANRPPDQRFWDLPEMLAVMRNYESETAIRPVDFAELRLVAKGPKELAVQLPNRQLVTPTHWSFGQLCSVVRAPASYLRRMPAERAAENLNADIENLGNEDPVATGYDEDREEEVRPSRAIIRTNGAQELMGLVSDKYGRIRNTKLVERVAELPDTWKPVPARPVGVDPYTPFPDKTDDRMWDPKLVANWSAQDLLSRPRIRVASAKDIEGINPMGLGCPVQVGDTIGPASLYGSHKEIVIMMVDGSRRIENGGLARGFILKNSEVGASSFVLWAFYFEGICGNHCIHGLRPLMEIKIVHLGGKAEYRAFSNMGPQLTKYANESVEADERLFAAARRTMLGDDRDEVVTAVFRRGILTQRLAREAYDLADGHRDEGLVDFDPRSVRGMLYGATRLSQRAAYTDQQLELDKSSGRLLGLVST